MLELSPYRLKNVQKLWKNGYEACTELIKRCLQNIESKSSFPNHIIISDVCVFHMDGKVNKYIGKSQGFKNFNKAKKRSCDGNKVKAWRKLSTCHVIGP